MLQQLLKNQQKYIDYFFQHVDLKSAEKLLQHMLSCKGTIIFCGVGKSGIIAEKIALTMTSTGTKALFLSPTNALHGDIGIVRAEDLFIMISRSGETDELLQLVPFLRNRKVTIACIVCTEENRLSRATDMTVVLPLEKELCPFDLLPTTSTAIQMIFGDLLAVSLMQSKQFSIEEYAQNHPGGKIGKRIALKVSDLMLKESDIPTCSLNAPIVDILVELSEKRCGCILIVDELKRLLGIFTDGDLRRTIQAYGAQALETPIGKVMSTTPRSISPEELAWKALHVMEADQKRPITVLPVLDEKKEVVGLIKMHDLVQAGVN